MASSSTTEAPTSEHRPAVIPSRNLAALRSRWDGHLQLQSTLTEFAEVVTAIAVRATAAHEEWEQRLYAVMSRLGATRHRVDLPSATTQRATEDEVARYAAIERRCAALLAELGEHVGNYTDTFVVAMRGLIAEYKSAPRDDPLAASEVALPTLHHPQLLEWARDVPPVAIDSSCFTVTEEREWRLGAPEREGRPYRIAVTCCTIDGSRPDIPVLYIGTRCGAVLAIGTDPLLSDNAAVASATETIGLLLQQRRRLSAAAAGAPLSKPPLVTVAAGSSGDRGVASVADLLRRRRSSRPADAAQGGHLLFHGHEYPVVCLHHFSHRGRALLASSSTDKTVRVSDATTAELVTVLAGFAGVVSTIAYHRPLAALLTAGFDGTVGAWDVQTGTQAAVVAVVGAPLHALHYEGALDTIYVGTRDGHVYGIAGRETLAAEVAHPRCRFGDATSRCLQCFLPTPLAPPHCVTEPGTTVICEGKGHRPSAAVVLITSIAGFLFSGDSEGCVVQWDAVHTKLVRKFHGHIDDITSISLTSDGFLFTSSRDALVLVWNMADGNMLRRINRHFGSVSGVVVGLLRDEARKTDGSAPSWEAARCELSAAADTMGDDSDGGGLSTPPVMLSISADETLILWHLRYEP